MAFLQKKLLSFSFIFMAVGSANLSAKKEIVTYQEVKNEYLKTFVQTQDENTSTEHQSVATDIKQLFEAISDYDQHELVANMFLQHGKQEQHSGVIDSTFIRKMELLCGGDKSLHHLLALLTPDSMSVFGRIRFASILINPIADLATLHQRQQALRGLHEIISTPYGETLKQSFEAIKHAQMNTLHYWQHHNEVYQQLLDSFYFPNYLNFLNKNTTALECSTRFDNLLTGIGISLPITLPLAAIAAGNAIKIYIQNKGKISQREACWESMKQIPNQIPFFSPFKKAFKERSYRQITTEFSEQIKQSNAAATKKSSYTYAEIKQRLDEYLNRHEQLFDTYQKEITPQSVGDVFDIIGYQAQEAGVSPIIAKAGTIAYFGIVFGMIVIGSKRIYNVAQFKNWLTNNVQERLICVATCVREAKSMYKLLNSHPDTAQMPAVQQLAHFFEKDGTRSAQLSDFLGKLQTATFKGEPSFFSITGRVLATHSLMQEVKDELIPLFEAVGEIEAYLAAATLYNKHLDLPAKFCFAELIEAEKPTVAIGSFWNPFIDPLVVVANNVVFNSFDSLTSYAEGYPINELQTARNAVVTGPNTAGKSTVIKSVGLNLLLAQTFGICAAERAVLTPFSTINCHLNITDDIASGSSLFQAEVQRARALLDDVRSLKQSEFCFTIMDEIFNGTNAEGGSEAAYKFLDQLGQYQNLIIIIATHFGKLTELESTGTFGNMHVGAYLDDAGTLIRPFKLEQGIFRDPENKVLQAILEREGILSAQTAA